MKIFCCAGVYIPSLVVLFFVGAIANHGNGTTNTTGLTDGKSGVDEIKNLNTHEIKPQGRFYYIVEPHEPDAPQAVVQTREKAKKSERAKSTYFDDEGPHDDFYITRYEGQDMHFIINFTVNADVSIPGFMYFASYTRGKRVDIYNCKDTLATMPSRSFDCLCSVCGAKNKDYEKVRVRSQPTSYQVDDKLQVSMDMVLYDLRKQDNGTVFTFIVNGQNITYAKLIVLKPIDHMENGIIVKSDEIEEDVIKPDPINSDGYSTVSIALGIMVLVLFVSGGFVVGGCAYRKYKKDCKVADGAIMVEAKKSDDADN